MRQLAKIQLWSLVIAIGVVLGLASVAEAQTGSEPAALLTSFEKVAFGSTQDIDAALALFSDNAVLTVTPAPAGTSGVWTGKDQIKQGLQFNKQQNVMRVNIGNPLVEGNKVTTNAKVTNNFFHMIGVGPVEHTTEVVVGNGKIKSYTSTMIVAEQQRVAAATKTFQTQHITQPAVSLPNTGTGQSTLSGTGVNMTIVLAGLLAVGLCSFVALFFVLRRTRLPK